MIRLRTGYIVIGIITGLLLVLSFFTTIPDGKLHITFCDVGQGDGMYIRFPNGKDMVIDGGPNNKIINCLSQYMPFWDRDIDMAILTHPDSDHLTGFLSVLERYHVSFVVRSDVDTSSEGFEKLKKMVTQKAIKEKRISTGETITVGSVKLNVFWPTKEQIALMRPSNLSILGAATTKATNEGSIVFLLSYGTFDALFTGDADSRVQGRLMRSLRHGYIPDGIVELFKVPHHGGKTGMTDGFFSFIRSDLVLQGRTFGNPVAVISVGKNSYGHPAAETIGKLEGAGFQVKRTDKEGDIEVVSDGKVWTIKN